MNLRVFGARRGNRRSPGLVGCRRVVLARPHPTIYPRRALFLVLLEGIVGPVFGCLAAVFRPLGPLWPGFFGVDVERLE